MIGPLTLTIAYFVLTAILLGLALWVKQSAGKIILIGLWTTLSASFLMDISGAIGFPASSTTVPDDVNILSFVANETSGKIWIWTMPDDSHGVPRAVAYPYTKQLHKLLSQWSTSDMGKSGAGRLVKKDGGQLGFGNKKGRGLEQNDTSTYEIQFPEALVPHKDSQ